MEIKHRFENVEGNITLDELEIISVSSKKNVKVDLCIKSNMNIPIARIKLYSRDRFVDAKVCFESAEAIGKEIERRWKLKDENKKLKSDNKWLWEVFLAMEGLSQSGSDLEGHELSYRMCQILHPELYEGISKEQAPMAPDLKSEI